MQSVSAVWIYPAFLYPSDSYPVKEWDSLPLPTRHLLNELNNELLFTYLTEIEDNLSLHMV